MATGPNFQNCFHETGRIDAEISGAGHVAKTLEVLQGLGVTGLESMTPAEVTARWNGLHGPMINWNMYFNPEAGWSHPRDSLLCAMEHFQALGGKFISGEQGEAVSFATDPDDDSTVIGVKTKDGALHTAKQVVCCIGADCPSLLDLGTQIQPVGWCVAHWRLEPDELRIWKDHPVVDLHRHGYFFPPNETGLMKMGLDMTWYHNLPVRSDGHQSVVSTPLRSSVIPAEAEEDIRWILRQAAPSLAKKPFFDTKVCWDGVTADHHWLITKHPEKKNLFVAAGGSGHAFKFFPIIGRYIVSLVMGELAPEYAEKWHWRIGTSDPRDAIQGRPMKDLKTSLGLSET